MYTGRLIDDLIESVLRAEADARVLRDEEIIQEFLETHMFDAAQLTSYVGVA